MNNTPSRSVQRLGALGIVYAVLYAVVGVINQGFPSAGASTTRVLQYYNTHFAGAAVSIFSAMAGSVVFIFFLGALRHALASTGESRVISRVVTAGGAVYVAGLLVSALMTNALLDAAHYRSAAAAAGINLIWQNSWVPFTTGLSAVALGTGVAALRGGGLPRWLAWASVVVGVFALAGPLGELASFLTPLWSATVGVTLMRSSGRHPASVPVQPSTVTTSH